MNMTRKNFLRWSAYSAGGIVLGTALPACGGGGGGGSDASAAADSSLRLTPTAVAAKPVPPVAPDGTPVVSGFVASLAASRISGVAPLYVNFDATGTTHHQSTNPTHELFYSWIFGDTGAGNWANGVQSPGLISKNTAFGPVTGHVFETPGTYVVKLAVMDGVNTTTKNVTITVQDPNVVFAGTNTICLSTTGNFTGAPSGSARFNVSSDIFTAFNTYKANNKRILFCKADSWTCSAQIGFNSLSNLTISGYGSGVAHTFASGTMVSVTPTAFGGEAGASMFLINAGNSDIKICNIRINSIPTVFASSINESISSVLYYKMEIRGCAQGFNAYMNVVSNKKIMDQLCLYECLVDEVYGYAGVDTPFASASGAIGSPGVFTATAHPFKINYKVRLEGTPPAPLSVGTNYYVTGTSLSANTFSLSATYGGSALALTGTGACTVRASNMGGGISAFVALVRGGVMGCYFDSCNHGEHTLRIPFIDRGHINNNYVARPNQGKSVVKIHSFIYDAVLTTWSEKFVLTANVMDTRGGYAYDPGAASPITQVGNCAIVIGSGGNSRIGGEWVRDGIVQNNFTFGGMQNPKNNRYFADIGCPDITLRNNIADFSFGDRESAFTSNYAHTGVHFVSLGSSTADQTVGVRIYNNTLYSNITNPEYANFVRINPPSGTDPVADQITIKNNLWYIPFYTGSNNTAYYNHLGSGTNIIASNNTDNGQTALASPNFTVTPPVALADWKPKAGSYAIKSGASVAVFNDFNQAPRISGANHMGAVLP